MTALTFIKQFYKKGDLVVVKENMDNSFLPDDVFLPKNSLLLYLDILEGKHTVPFNSNSRFNLLKNRDVINVCVCMYKEYEIYIPHITFVMYYKLFKKHNR